MLWIIPTLVAFAILSPGEACAWGPITHLAHGSEVLSNLNIVGGVLQDLLARHPLEYLYGCVGADITQAKKYTRAMAAHCHSWRVGWQLREAARTDAERAFAWGYLSHLAADVYAHSHFVPTQLIVSFSAGTLRHVYWETRFDSLQSPRLRGLMQDLRRKRFHTCDALVEKVVARTLFSFRTNKRIFNSVLAWQGFEQWHRVVLAVDGRSRFLLLPKIVPIYNQLCGESIVTLLRSGKKSSSQAGDPTGRRELAQAMAIRRTLRLLLRRGQITADVQREIDALALRPDTLLSAKTQLPGWRQKPLRSRAVGRGIALAPH